MTNNLYQQLFLPFIVIFIIIDIISDFSYQLRCILHLLFIFLIFFWVKYLKPIPQKLSFHNFADQRTIFKVPHFHNVISNFPFLFLGIYGYYRLSFSNFLFNYNTKLLYIIFLFAMIGVSFGSGYFHLNPNNSTLFYDRLPMSMGFITFYFIILDDILIFNYNRRFLLIGFFIFLFFAIYTVFYWKKYDDKKYYLLIQYGVLLHSFNIILTFPTYRIEKSKILISIFLYISAKITEALDARIYHLLYQSFSGHTIKHLLAAYSIFYLIQTISI